MLVLEVYGRPKKDGHIATFIRKLYRPWICSYKVSVEDEEKPHR